MSDAADAFTGTKAVDERHRLDEARLEPWLRAHVDGFEGPLEIRQFKGGQSNPTYELATPGARYVLRRKPPGKLLPSAPAEAPVGRSSESRRRSPLSPKVSPNP